MLLRDTCIRSIDETDGKDKGRSENECDGEWQCKIKDEI
jgi:hypothetical protein